jgi:hypothetical protein
MICFLVYVLPIFLSTIVKIKHHSRTSLGISCFDTNYVYIYISADMSYIPLIVLTLDLWNTNKISILISTYMLPICNCIFYLLIESHTL